MTTSLTADTPTNPERVDSLAVRLDNLLRHWPADNPAADDLRRVRDRLLRQGPQEASADELRQFESMALKLEARARKMGWFPSPTASS